MGLTKKRLVTEIAAATALTQVSVKEVVQRVFDGIMDEVVESGRIELRGFGVFVVKLRSRRTARNPRTGLPVEVPAKRIITMTAGTLWLKRLNSTKPARVGPRP